MKRLEIGNFQVKDIRFGDVTEYRNGILTVNEKEAVQAADPDGQLVNTRLYIAHPGDSIRIVPAKACVEPRYRPDGRCIFPGFTGPAEGCGDGIIYAMKQISVVAAGKIGSGADGMIDMSGPGAVHCAHARTINLVIYGENKDDTSMEGVLDVRVSRNIRLAGLRLAEYIGKTVADQTPDDWEIYDLEEGRKEAEEKHLPKVALYMQFINQAEGMNDFFLGHDGDNILPNLVHPNAVLDGFFVAGSGLMGQAISTYDFQNFLPLKALYQQHGKTINFAGVVTFMSPVSDDEKRRNAVMAAEIGSLLGLDGAIVDEYCGGCNSDVDYIYTIAELEDRGIKTVGISTEHNGKVTLDPKADALVSSGDTGIIIELPPMDLVIGDIQTVVRDSYYGAWPDHEEYGPSLRPDGSLIVSVCMLDTSANGHGSIAKAILDC